MKARAARCRRRFRNIPTSATAIRASDRWPSPKLGEGFGGRYQRKAMPKFAFQNEMPERDRCRNCPFRVRSLLVLVVAL